MLATKCLILGQKNVIQYELIYLAFIRLWSIPYAKSLYLKNCLRIFCLQLFNLFSCDICKKGYYNCLYHLGLKLVKVISIPVRSVISNRFQRSKSFV